MKEPEDAEVADSGSREDQWWEELPVRTGGGGRARTDGRWALARRRVTPSPQRGGGGIPEGQVGRSEDGDIWSEKEQDKETRLLSQIGERSSVGMDGAGRGVGTHWESHFGDRDCVSKRWPMERLDG